MVPTIVILGYPLIALLAFIVMRDLGTPITLRGRMMASAIATPICLTGAIVSWVLLDVKGTYLTSFMMFAQFTGFTVLAFYAAVKAAVIKHQMHEGQQLQPFTLLQGGLR